MITSLSPEIENSIPPAYRWSGTASSVEAAEFCRKLATSHYENFLVATAFCPKPLRPHFYSVYAYCRISDDLGDEIGDTQVSLALLDWWEAELDAMVAGSPGHPVFVALQSTVQEFGIPAQPFRDLLTAFRQDQRTPRYQTFDELLGYCKNSANPVGRLVLYLGGYSDDTRQALSDYTCTALQLANFWQDVTRDILKGRIYIPLDDMARFGVVENDIQGRRFTPQFAQLMKYEVDRTRDLFTKGEPLLKMVDRRLQLDLQMFTAGGVEVLRRIEAQGYDVLTARPSIPKSRQLTMLAKRLVRL